MRIPGIEPILYQSGAVVRAGERPPSARLVQLIDMMNKDIAVDYTFDRKDELREMASMPLEPSQQMRLCYFEAHYWRDNSVKRQLLKAYRVFGDALDLAMNQNDLDSQVVLTDQRALMLYGKARPGQARIDYEVAFGLWQERALQLAKPPIEPEIHFRERIGTTLFLTGDFDAAEGSLARALTLVAHHPDVRPSKEVREISAKALWTLGLIHRAQSDMQDGSESLLLDAVQRFKEAIEHFGRANAHQYNVARIYVQLAETCLDLSDLYLQRQQDKEANAMRAKAQRAALKAQIYHRYSDDTSGMLLCELTLLRCEITQLLDIKSVQQRDEFDRRLMVIERQAADLDDKILSAKAAKLRGEWLLWMTDAPHARDALLQAVIGMDADNMGEATGSQRLLRRSNDDARPQRVRRPRANGPRVSRARRNP